MSKTETEPAKVNELLKQGEYVYELFSIMIHTGGAFGGHYFAYIKSFEDGKWYNFNDSTVTALESEEDIFKTFGGKEYGQSNTAYMLMYRKVSGNESQFKFSEEMVPEYLRTEIAQET